MEPMTWGVLAASTATWSVKKLASLGAGTGWKKLESAVQRSGLDHELTGAYESAFQGFVEMLRGPFVIDNAMDANLRVMFSDEGFQAILAELPRRRFETVDTTRARELFVGLGLPGANDSHFDFAWATFGRVFRERIAQTTHAAKLAELSQLDLIESYLAELAGRGRPRDESAVLAAYRRFVEDRYRLADTRGLFWREKESTGEEIRLGEIFVETLLQRRNPRFERGLDKEDDGRRAKEEDEEDGRRTEGDEALSSTYGAVREDPRTVADVLASERRLVILGPPGSGKSTLAQCLALALVAADVALSPMPTGLPVETVPILLTLKTYAASLKQQSNLKLDAFLEEQLGPQLPDLDDVLGGSQALVLLDGLDEVFDEGHRRWVSSEVSRLMSRYSKARFVLTSRPRGYWAAPVSGAVPLFEMVAFDDERIRQFFRGWFTALARQGYDHEPGRTAEQRAAALADDVLGRPRIRSLAENPMLCTLIVLVHRSRSGRLPERRVKFYEAAVAVLTEHWEKAKYSPKQEMQLDFPEPELMVGVLAEVAWKAQTELKSREIPADKLEAWIEGALAEDPDWSRKRKNAARDLLHVIQDRTGLLVDAGGDGYQFVHLSLHEYLVAFYLLDRMDDERCCRVVRHFVHVPEWEEILRLTIGAASRNRADALVRAILGKPTSEWEEVSRRDLRFVCRCMQDRPNVSEGVRGDVRSRWLKILEDRSHDNETALISDGVGLGLTSEARAAFEARLVDDYWEVRYAAIEYFTRVGADDEKTRAAVEARLADDDTHVRQSAIKYFAQIGTDDKKTRVAIETRLMDYDFHVRQSAIKYFAQIGADDEKTRAAFEARLVDDDVHARQSAVEYFIQIGAGDEKTRAAVEARLADDDAHVRQSAVKYFAQISNDEKTRAAVKTRLTDDDAYVRQSAIRYFAQIGADDEKTRVVVEARLTDDDENVRSSVIWYFVQIGADDEKTRAAVETRLTDGLNVQLSAVEYFAQIGADDEKTRAAFEARLTDDNENVRQSAIRYFAQIGADDEKTRAAVETRLVDNKWVVRRSAVEYFIQIGADDEKTRAAVEARLVDDDEDVQALAVTFFVENGLRDRAITVLDAFTTSAAELTSGETDQKLVVAIGRRAAEDDALLKRITEEQIPHFPRSHALAAAAERRDEIRRASTPLADVLEDTATPKLPTVEPPSTFNEPLRMVRLVVDHLRVFDHLSLDLSPAEPDVGQWTLLLGDNAVGKTTLLRAIALACIEQPTASALLELTGITAPFVRHEADAASFTLWTSAGEIECSITPNTTTERLKHKGPTLPGAAFAYGCQRGTAFGGPMRDVEFRPIDSVGTLFNDNAHLIHAETWLQEASLAAMKGGVARAAFYEALRSTLLAILPGVESLDFDENAQLWLDGPKIGRSPLAAMSDGYVTTVGWIIDLIARWAELSHRRGVELDGDFRHKMTGLVLIDEIDLHLHPLWQTEIVTSLRQQFPKMSFVATTHNPLTLMGAKSGEIHVLRRDCDTGQVSVHQQDIVPGMSADDILTGEWFGLASTLDPDTQDLLDQHRVLLRDGVTMNDPGRRELEKILRQRLGMFPSTSLDRMVQSIAAELMGNDFRRKTPEERQKIRQQILERARQEKAGLSR